MFDPGKQTNAEFKRRVFVGIGAGAAAVGTTLAAALAQTPPPAIAEDDPAIHTERVMLPTGISAYAAVPKNASASTPGVVMVQHIWGVDATIRDDVRRYAKQGYVTIAPELFGRNNPPSGDGVTDIAVFRPLAQKLDEQQVNGDLQAAADWIRKRAGVASNVRPPKVGITGFCMGGAIALRQTWQNPKAYDAASIFYGAVKDQRVDLVAVPIAGNYGARDTGIPADDVRAFFAALKQPHDVKVYDEAGHAFFDDTRASYVASAAADSWARTLAFFHKYLTA
jgi:carboxymethylenebutenolidase